MFRRTRPEESETVDSGTVKQNGKGRPTPSRREAEAAARARARPPRSRREASKLMRQRRAQENARMREALKSGDERHLPARDKGKVRRFVRDRVDARLSMAEFLLPALLVILVLTSTSNPSLVAFGNGLWTATILLVAADTAFLVWQLKRDLRRRFAGENTKGAVLYGVLRAVNMRFFRMPKPQVKLGQRLPDRY